MTDEMQRSRLQILTQFTDGEVESVAFLHSHRTQTRRTKMKFRTWISITSICQLAAPAITVQASAQTIATFDAPGAGTGSGQGTLPSSLNLGGVIQGAYIDSGGGVYHGFLCQ